jgi:signal transduction histidine kinase
MVARVKARPPRRHPYYPLARTPCARRRGEDHLLGRHESGYYGSEERRGGTGRTGDELLEKATREVEQLLDESIAASRSLTTELSPPILHDSGLNDGLEWLARRMADKHGLFVELSLEETCPLLAEDVRILLFESVRELLFNAVKHSRSRSATVGSRLVDGRLQVLVSDHGAGFDPKAIPPAGELGGGFGLFSIRERLELIGGCLEIESAPGKGSRFLLTAPLAQSEVVPLQPEPTYRRKSSRPRGGVPCGVMRGDARVLSGDQTGSGSRSAVRIGDQMGLTGRPNFRSADWMAGSTAA